MPYLQRWALSRTTQRRTSPAELESLRRHIADVSSEELAPLVRLVRVRPRTFVMVVTLTAAFYVLLPQLANVDEGLDSLGSANWWWLGAAVVMSILTYVFAAIGLMGAAAVPLPFGRTVEAQLASSFVNRLTPANVGGLALNVRFMQRRGIEPAAAISATGINLAAGALVHAGLLVVSLAWAGQGQGQGVLAPEQQHVCSSCSPSCWRWSGSSLPADACGGWCAAMCSASSGSCCPASSCSPGRPSGWPPSSAARSA